MGLLDYSEDNKINVIMEQLITEIRKQIKDDDIDELIEHADINGIKFEWVDVKLKQLENNDLSVKITLRPTSKAHYDKFFLNSTIKVDRVEEYAEKFNVDKSIAGSED
jgi:hypothetical protein